MMDTIMTDRDLLMRIDERTETMEKQLTNIFERVERLEQKDEFCSMHQELIRDVSSIKIDSKVLATKIGLFAALVASVGVWILEKFTHF